MQWHSEEPSKKRERNWRGKKCQIRKREKGVSESSPLRVDAVQVLHHNDLSLYYIKAPFQ